MSTDCKITNRACIFALNTQAANYAAGDLTLIKEAVELEDGTVERVIRLVENIKRPYWITKKGAQNHKQKRENEKLINLDRYECTQSELPFALNRRLNYIGGERPRLPMLCRSPYVYGTDVDVTTIVKKQLDDQYEQEFKAPYKPVATRAMLDYETDVVHGTEIIIAGSLTMGKDAYIATTDKFAGNIDDIKNKIIKFANKSIGEIIKKRDLTFHVKVVKDDMEVVRSLMGIAHQLKPDFLAIWNMRFDMGKMLESCDRHGVHPADVFCAPEVPFKYRTFKYREAKQKKKKANGAEMNLDPADLWHVVDCLASFYIIDAMSTFRMIRSVQQMRASYALDAILKTEVKIGKLKWEGASHIPSDTIEWHRFMQKDMADPENRIAYLVYCSFDCISMEILDDKTKDLSLAILTYSGISQLSRVKSNPKRLADAYHFFLMEKHDRILCSTSDNMREEFDSVTIGTRDWIITVCNSLSTATSTGIYVDEYKHLERECRIHRFVWDIDIRSSYPSNQAALNMSKGTTLVEVCQIEGLPEGEQRRISVNMTNVRSNAVDIGVTVLGLPTMTELSAMYAADHA